MKTMLYEKLEDFLDRRFFELNKSDLALIRIHIGSKPVPVAPITDVSIIFYVKNNNRELYFEYQVDGTYEYKKVKLNKILKVIKKYLNKDSEFKMYNHDFDDNEKISKCKTKFIITNSELYLKWCEEYDDMHHLNGRNISEYVNPIPNKKFIKKLINNEKYQLMVFKRTNSFLCFYYGQARDFVDKLYSKLSDENKCIILLNQNDCR